MAAAIHTPEVRRRVEDLLCLAGVYRPARSTYQRLFNRDLHRSRRRDREFFSRFIARGDLVFDIGANEGRVTQTFAELGAKVVAVEPNPELATRVRARYGSRAVTVEAVAVGAEPGEAPLRLGRESGHSTLSVTWQRAVGEEEGARRWERFVLVPVTTLDALIERHGRPGFVKIDVEGYEAEVLGGLHEPLPALSFEFLCRAPEVTRRAVAALEALGTYEYELAHDEEHRIEGRWRNAAELLDVLADVASADPDGYGDVYARLAGT
jgi:FkbM family methyltransferase